MRTSAILLVFAVTTVIFCNAETSPAARRDEAVRKIDACLRRNEVSSRQCKKLNQNVQVLVDAYRGGDKSVLPVLFKFTYLTEFYDEALLNDPDGFLAALNQLPEKARKGVAIGVAGGSLRRLTQPQFTELRALLTGVPQSSPIKGVAQECLQQLETNNASLFLNYFPPQTFTGRTADFQTFWYSRDLYALGEQPLWSPDSSGVTYRFTHLGAFTGPKSATLTVSTPAAGVIKHIFFMLQENRSFDMYLGQLGPYRSARLSQAGITDTQTVDGFDPNATLFNFHTGVHVKPFHEATVCTENLSPAWDESHHDVSLTGGDGAWNTTTTFTNSSFAMNGFLDTTGSVTQNSDPNGTRAMGFYNQDDLPYYYDLATFFATSDSWHSPALANTYPNRFYLMAGTSFGHQYPDGDANHPKYAAKTIFRAMNDANVSWTYYFKDGIFLANFQDFFNPAIEPKTVPISDLLSRLGGVCSGNPCDPDKSLPQVIFIDSPSGGSGLDEHPENNVQKGAAFVQSIISALMNSDAWNDSVFILSYDEGGGLYDHVPPFTVPLPDGFAPGNCPDPNNGSFGYCRVGKLGGTFDLTGFRVPVIVISPFAKPHFVSHTPRDYTAILAFIEKTFNIPSLSARDAFWQDPSRDMSEFFDFSAPNLLHAPTGVPWTQFLPAQPTTALCDQTKEAGPTF